MRSRVSIVGVAIIAIAAALTGCSHGSSGRYSGSYSSDSGWGNYKCKAINTGDSGRVSVGWASNEAQARDNAMDKCHAQSGEGSCKILDCTNEM
ncbi:MAG: hypothetical protein A3F17_00400 [Gammaproteobacteria bacterium RIFCSPHIGHO2_12_FULL_41_15]|nr:MAG: hypothetical protein A3F17_00400 [Gammaproteobacteria bacterium RIFCSPHIGHO2_12_FULL_41_15]